MTTTTFSLVRAPDGTGIATEQAGRADGPALVLLHGIAQSRHSWRAVLAGPLAADFRLVALDLRGHGDSDKPAGDEAYASGDRLGGDLHAVITQLGLTRPVVVAWSYGGVVLGEYLRHHGDGQLGGALLVAAAMLVGRPARSLFGPVMMGNARALLSDDPAVYEAGARAFLGACAATPLDPAGLDSGLAAMQRVPPHVRRALLSRSEDYSSELARTTTPLATVHGSLDPVVLPAMSEHVRAVAPATVSTTLEGVGHLPWLESRDAFDAAVRALVSRAGEPRGA